MRLIVADHYENARHEIEGDENDIKSQLLDLYPWLLTKFGPHCDIKILVNALNKHQATTARIFDDMAKAERYLAPSHISDGTGMHVIRYDQDDKHGQIATTDNQLEACRAAGEFLAGHPCTDKEMRQALLQEDGDPIMAAIVAHGLPITCVEDMKAVLETALNKSEEEAVRFKDVTATTTSAKMYAEAVKKASDAGEIRHVALGRGKHNHGMLMAKDPETHRAYILKPGSGKQNPILGETESGSSQSQREAAFFAIAQSWGLGEDMPEAHLLLIDGNEYACMRMLPRVFKNFNDLKQQDPDLPRRLLALYNDGTLHKWATMDYVLGNPDRHSGNLMASGDKVKLIDHGSSFAGDKFAPAKDGMSFVPYYLRPGTEVFNKLSTEDKLRKLPRLNPQNEVKFRKWLLDLSVQTLGNIMTQYGIDSSPERDRLERLQASTAYQNADLAILSCWVVG
jgi:hypothetical protein